MMILTIRSARMTILTFEPYFSYIKRPKEGIIIRERRSRAFPDFFDNG